MSQTLERYELGDLGLRDAYDEIIAPSYSSTIAHLPANERGTETVCVDLTHYKSVDRKPFAVFPDGYYQWCHGCVRRAGHADWPDGHHPARPAQTD